MIRITNRQTPTARQNGSGYTRKARQHKVKKV